MKKEEDIISVIKDLRELHKFERIFYNATTVISFLVLLFGAIFIIFKDNGKYDAILGTGMFGSSGVIAFTSGRILKMWGDAVDLVKTHYGRNRYEKQK